MTTTGAKHIHQNHHKISTSLAAGSSDSPPQRGFTVSPCKCVAILRATNHRLDYLLILLLAPNLHHCDASVTPPQMADHRAATAACGSILSRRVSTTRRRMETLSVPRKCVSVWAATSVSLGFARTNHFDIAVHCTDSANRLDCSCPFGTVVPKHARHAITAALRRATAGGETANNNDPKLITRFVLFS